MIKGGKSENRGTISVKDKAENSIGFYGKEDNFKKFETFFEVDEKESTKIEDSYLEKVWKLKDEYKEIDIKNPNEFIKTLFSEVE